MPENKPRFILANGEKFVTPVPKRGFGGPQEFPRTYEEARLRLKGQIGEALAAIQSLPDYKRVPGEAVLCLRMHPDKTAKSYDPEMIFQQVQALEKVGSRSYREQPDLVGLTKRVKKSLDREDAQVLGRLVFVRGSERGFNQFARTLDQAETALSDRFRTEVRCVERLDLLAEEEQLSAFKLHANWEQGRVEFVLHPSRRTPEQQLEFFHRLFEGSTHSLGRVRHADYSGGPLFVSGILHRDDLPRIAGANPLRTARPMVFKGFQPLRASTGFKAPPASTATERSTIKVGVFDGGLDPDHLLLKGHVEQDDSLSIAAPPDVTCLAHGTAVAGALLFGSLHQHDSKAPLPGPPVSVVSFRVLPTSDPADIDLYESIDVIESVVPARKDISVYNISLGPEGPIEDDSISRFTYALDMLAHEHQVTFCVAVGNDGDQGPDLGRIQSPSDLVNGIGVGAFTIRDGKKTAADYSCVGPGRECAKLKPDLVAFGGCDKTPFHLLSTDPSLKSLDWGTSFSTPLVSSLVAQAVQGMDRGSALLARTLVIHNADHPDGSPDHSLGHGAIKETLEQLLACGAKEMSILYQNSIEATKSVKLPMLLPHGLVTKGRLMFRWTIGILPEVDPNQVSDYTKVCIEDSFYPNSQKFRFSPPKGVGGSARVLHLADDSGVVADLLAEGWKQSLLPVSDSGNDYHTEDQLRAGLKWEPVVRKKKSKLALSVEDPFLVLHATPRGGFTGRVSYAAVVTITATEDVDLYQAVLQRNPVLQPVRLKAQAELRVRI